MIAKRLMFMLVVLMVITLVSSVALADSSGTSQKGPYPIKFEGLTLNFSIPPKIVNGHLMVPLRDVTNQLGITLNWDATHQAVSASKNGLKTLWKLGSTEVTVSNKDQKLLEQPILWRNRMLVSLRDITTVFGYNISWNESAKYVSIATPGLKLPLVGTKDRLLALLKESMSNPNDMRVMAKAMPALTADSGNSTSKSADSASGTTGSFSQTNVQTAGVDEADIIKTDGTYIYKVNPQNQNVVIAKAVPAEKMTILNTIDFKDPNFSPFELYVDNKYLVVLGSYYSVDTTTPQNQGTSQKKMYVPPGLSTTKAMIYDISDKSKIKKMREVELEGNYVTSRKIGNSLYMVTNKWLDYYTIMNPEAQAQVPLTPQYRDSNLKTAQAYTAIPISKISYFPEAIVPNYVLVGAIDLSNTTDAVQINSYLGSGDNVYASLDHLYVAMSESQYTSAPVPMVKPAAGDAAISLIDIMPTPVETNTLIYKFKLNPRSVTLVANGKVPGTLLNQFSMDEYEGYLRIATTKGNTWGNEGTPSTNHVYTLDAEMKLTGKLENLAPGERIYSVRFMGKRGYVVTFKTVDPLFVIDLANPSAPRVLGELKIPGYSSYLHPYDENHIIGFGVDTEEIVNEWDPEKTKIAITQGMKIAVFDVTNVNKPIEKFKESIGVRGTHSDLLYNHKALLFSKEKELLAFPVMLYEASTEQKDSRQYGKLTFQGMYVYQFNLIKGFQLRGRITHMTPADMKKMETDYYGMNYVQRGLYINDVLYTVSDDTIKANRLSNLEEIAQITTK